MRATLLALLSLLAGQSFGQAFNIDLDEPVAPPDAGGGAPSSNFGAAAAQQGRWNRITSTSRGPVSLLDLAGIQSSVSYSVDSHGNPMFGIAVGPFANTGDYALLLNDAVEVGTVVQGGTLTFKFDGLQSGTYDVYTYAVSPRGGATPASVIVQGSVTSNPQIVTGPMPGNDFAVGVTHSVHRVAVTAGALRVVVHQPPGTQLPYPVNGFQLVVVPEHSTLVTLTLGAFIVALRRRYNLRQSCETRIR